MLSYIFLIAQGVIGFIYVPLLLHYMGRSEYGLYQLMGSIIAYFSVMDFGLSATIIRYYSKYKSLNDQKNMENVLAIAGLIYSCITILIVLVGIIVYFNLQPIFSGSLKPQELVSAKRIFLIMLLNIAMTIPSQIFDAVITSNERFVFIKLASIIQTIMQPFVVIAILTVYPYALGMVIVQTLFNVLLISTKVGYCLFRLKARIRLHHFDGQLCRAMLLYSFFIFLSAVMDQVFWRTNVVILGIVANTAVVAVYGVANQLFNSYMSLSTAITSVFLPRVTDMVVKNESDSALTDLFIKIGRVQFLLLALVLSGFILFGKQFILLWAGKGFEDAYFITILLIAPFTVDLIQNIGLTILQAENKLAFRSIVFLALAIANIFISIPMAIHFSAIGCALTTGLTFLIAHGIVLNIYYQRMIHINVMRFWKNIVKIGGPCIICMIFGVGLNIGIHFSSNALSLLCKILIYTVLYFIISWKFTMNPYEKQIIKRPLRAIFLK